MDTLKRTVMGLLFSAVLIVNCSVHVQAADVVQDMELVQIGFEEMSESDQVAYEGIYNCENSPFMRSPSIGSASLRVTPRSDEILVEVYTACNFMATKIGIRDIFVQEKVWYGWKTIAQAKGGTTDTNSYGCQAHCTNAEKGKTYRVLCTHYAVESNGTEHIVENKSEEFVYN